MTAHYSEIESLLTGGELWAAGDVFSRLRPALKSSLEGLMLSARIHGAAKRWENVDVLCRVIRKEFPGDVFGFAAGAESLRQQGRDDEATNLLNGWMAVET
jgi:hypothetical protein